MKKTLFIAFGVLVVAVGVWWVFYPSNECSGEACGQSSQQPLAKQAVIKAEQGQAYLYDVRTPEEFNQKHAQQAINFDVELIKAGEYPDIPKDSTIYVYCRSGNRSAQATALLKQAGYTNVTDLGGLDQMEQAGVY
ncbi:MAG: rhodanese-like domain-containing protein [Patescibacteria group bacterium]|jgi:phage shock protein E|nr:rhodanese-like domain-containing protein [Patescibacteria group bacterium]